MLSHNGIEETNKTQQTKKPRRSIAEAFLLKIERHALNVTYSDLGLK